LIYSLFLHICQPDHGIHSSFETGLIIQFPDFNTKALIGKNDVYIDTLPTSNNTALLDADDQPLYNVPNLDMVPFCHNIKQFQDDLHQETIYLDSLLHHPRQYYDLVRTKRQRNM
jgi:hypothetical protein